MTKKEQIKEMADFLFDSAENYCDADGHIITNKLAEALYNAGYRKYDDDNLMLESKIKVLEATIERIDNEKAKYLESIENLTSGKCCLRCPLVEVGRKETAKEIYKMLLGTEHITESEQKEHCEWWVSKWRIEDLNRVFKEFGVEIEQ